MVEEHRGDDSGVARVVVGEARVRGVVAAEAGAGGRGLGDRTGHVLRVGAQHRREDLAQRRLLRVGAQQVDVRLEGVDVEGGEERGGLLGGAEAAQAVELGEGADQFGLVVGVLVVAVRGVDRDAPALLVLVALPCLFEVGVHLEGEGGTGCEEFQEERQAGAEPGDGGAAEFLRRVLGDDLVERTAPGARGCAGVGAHPHLRLRFAGRLHAEQPGDGGGGTPGVGADGVVEAVHRCLLLHTCAARPLGAGVGREAWCQGRRSRGRTPSTGAGREVTPKIRPPKRAPGKRRRNP